MNARLRDLPIGAYGAVMGLAGLGLSLRAAAPLFPGAVQAPAYVTEPFVLAGLIAFAVLFPAYLLKLIFHAKAVKEEFDNPATLGFCASRGYGKFSEKTLLRMEHFSGICLLVLALFHGGRLIRQLAIQHL